MRILYNISIYIYMISIYIYALLNSKAKEWTRGRRNILKKIQKATKNHNNIVWFHCASLGEYEQGKSLIKAYKEKFTEDKILLTFFSPSGYNIIKYSPLADFVFYLPSDTISNARKFIAIVRPIKVFFIKYEFWFNYMNEIKKEKIPLYSVSSIFRKEQVFFKYSWVTKQLKNFTHFFVQDKNSTELLKSIGFNNNTVIGDSRFDTVLSNSKNPAKNPLIKKFSRDKHTIVCGSTWPKDEKLLIQYIKNNPNKNYIIAPHELQNMSNLSKQTNSLLYSKANEKSILTVNVLIIDNIGLLSNIYQFGDTAYIGGGFGAGIHNILEAVAFGLPVVFGPNYRKSNEAKELIELKGGISILNYKSLTIALDSFNTYDRSIAMNYIKENSGASKKILDSINT